MTNRREFLQTTALVATAPLTARAGFAYPSATKNFAVIVDDRFIAAKRFGVRASQEGIATRTIQGDITALWFNELHANWSKQPTPIAGLTERPALFCLEQLAWDHRMRVVYHAEHAPSSNEQIMHDVYIAAGNLNVSAFDSAASNWPEYAASSMAKLRFDTLTARGPSTACMPAAQQDKRGTLHSWAIAPVERARQRIYSTKNIQESRL
jgi:hypothetical protein